jgi:hypothetical protein
MLLVLSLAAVAIGGVVFALTSDFVIGVGVGATVLAFGRQVSRAWGHKGGPPAPTALEPDREPVHR